MPTPIVLAIIYCRVSTSKQVREGDGLNSQEKRCRDYAAARGYTVLRVFQEPAVTGAVEKRRAMTEVLAYLDAHEGEIVVIIDDIKRWAREVRTHFDLKAEILKRGGRLESPLFHFEDTPEGKFVETIMAAQAELERNQNLRQVLNRMKARLEQGYWTFQAPPGYRFKKHLIHKKLLVLEEPKASLVTEALGGFATDRFGSTMEVYRFLRDAGFFGLSRSKDPTRHIMQVHRILRQILYTGYIEYKPWGITLRKGQHPSLITLADFHRIQEKLSGRSKTLKRVDTREEFPLRNFAACPSCGHLLTGSLAKGKYPYYHCFSRLCPLFGTTIRKDEIERDFGTMLKSQRSRPEAVELARMISYKAWSQQQERERSAIGLIGGRLKQIGTKIDRLSDRIEDTESDVVSQTLEKRVENLVREQRLLEEKATHASAPAEDFGTQFSRVEGMLENPYQTWESGGLYLKRVITRMVFTGPLPYTRGKGFGTPEVSLPYLVMRQIAASDCNLVDPSLRSWNAPNENLTDQIGQSTWMEFIEVIKKWSDSLAPPGPCVDATAVAVSPIVPKINS